MFDRKVHHINEKGEMVRSTPFTETIRHGHMTLICTHDGKLITPDGAPYPLDKMHEDDKKRYAHLIKKNEPVKIVSRETEESDESLHAKKRGRPAKEREVTTIGIGDIE